MMLVQLFVFADLAFLYCTHSVLWLLLTHAFFKVCLFSLYTRYYLKARAFHGTLVQDEEAEVGPTTEKM